RWACPSPIFSEPFGISTMSGGGGPGGATAAAALAGPGGVAAVLPARPAPALARGGAEAFALGRGGAGGGVFGQAAALVACAAADEQDARDPRPHRAPCLLRGRRLRRAFHCGGGAFGRLRRAGRGLLPRGGRRLGHGIVAGLLRGGRRRWRGRVHDHDRLV